LTTVSLLKGENTKLYVTNITDRLKHISLILQGSTDSLRKCERQGSWRTSTLRHSHQCGRDVEPSSWTATLTG